MLQQIRAEENQNAIGELKLKTRQLENEKLKSYKKKDYFQQQVVINKATFQRSFTLKNPTVRAILS